MQPGRNEPCPCGSGKKYKKCCGAGTAPSTPDGQSASLDAAIAAFETGRYAAAADAAQTFTRTHPNEPVAWQVLGISAYYLGDVAAAAGAFDRLVKLDNRNSEAWSNLAQMRCELGELESAFDAANRAIKLQPTMPEAHNNLGNIHRARHDHAQAEASYRRAIELGLETPQTYCNLGSVLQGHGDFAGARDAYEKALVLDANFAPAHSNLGGLLLIEDEMQSARHYLEKAYALMPDDYNVLGNMGKYWQETGDLEQARALYERALAMQPDNPESHFRLGGFYQQTGDNGRARLYLLKAIQIDLHHAKSLAALGKIAFIQGLVDESEKYYRAAMQYGGEDLLIVRDYCEYLANCRRYTEAESILNEQAERHPDNTLVLLGLAELYTITLQQDRAAEIYSQLVESHPDNADYLVRWSMMEEMRHRVDKAIELAGKAIAIEPEIIKAHLALARALSRDKKYEAALDELEKINKQKLSQDSIEHYNLLFERASLEDKLRRYDAAYEDLTEANTIKSHAINVSYDSESEKREYASLKKTFSKANFARLPKVTDSGRDSIRPIFIVGFPRSGTTLLEQILASHSAVCAGDELSFMRELANQIKSQYDDDKSNAENLLLKVDEITLAMIGKWHDYYLGRVNEQRIVEPGFTYFTDKMPHNLLWLGLISLIFPTAPIIHITRHPMDACLSTFMANFTRGHHYTTSMESIATHYAQIMDLAEHYKHELDMNYLQIRYEDILDNLEGKVREVLEFVGLPWEEACLKFHESKRISKTASYAQVTQKLYTSSRYRYKNYYKHLEPLEPILRETMQWFGYTFEP